MRRLLALLVATSALALAAPAHAKSFTYTDPKGDMPANPGLDIVSVTYGTEGTTTVTKVRGKKVKTYTPVTLVASMTLAGAPMDQEGIRYRVASQVTDCGAMTFNYAPSLAGDAVLQPTGLSVTCGGETLFLAPKVSIKGNTLTWSIKLKSLPKAARVGAIHYSLNSSVDVVEPVLGLLGPDDAGSGILDTARSDADWEVA